MNCLCGKLCWIPRKVRVQKNLQVNVKDIRPLNSKTEIR